MLRWGARGGAFQLDSMMDIDGLIATSFQFHVGSPEDWKMLLAGWLRATGHGFVRDKILALMVTQLI